MEWRGFGCLLVCSWFGICTSQSGVVAGGGGLGVFWYAVGFGFVLVRSGGRGRWFGCILVCSWFWICTSQSGVVAGGGGLGVFWCAVGFGFVLVSQGVGGGSVFCCPILSLVQSHNFFLLAIRLIHLNIDWSFIKLHGNFVIILWSESEMTGCCNLEAL